MHGVDRFFVAFNVFDLLAKSFVELLLHFMFCVSVTFLQDFCRIIWIACERVFFFCHIGFGSSLQASKCGLEVIMTMPRPYLW